MNRQEILKWYAKEFEKISKEIKGKKELSYYDFLRIRNFKLQNSSREEEKSVEEITKIAFDLASKDKIEESINKLLELHGVAIPIASTILAMRFPEKFCIIDRVCISNLGKTEWLKKYLTDSKIYRDYLLLMRKNAKERKINLRKYERSLFENRE